MRPGEIPAFTFFMYLLGAGHLKHFLKWLYKCTKKDKMDNRKLYQMKKGESNEKK